MTARVNVSEAPPRTGIPNVPQTIAWLVAQTQRDVHEGIRAGEIARPLGCATIDDLTAATAHITLTPQEWADAVATIDAATRSLQDRPWTVNRSWLTSWAPPTGQRWPDLDLTAIGRVLREHEERVRAAVAHVKVSAGDDDDALIPAAAVTTSRQATKPAAQWRTAACYAAARYTAAKAAAEIDLSPLAALVAIADIAGHWLDQIAADGTWGPRPGAPGDEYPARAYGCRACRATTAPAGSAS